MILFIHRLFTAGIGGVDKFLSASIIQILLNEYYITYKKQRRSVISFFTHKEAAPRAVFYCFYQFFPQFSWELF